MQDVNRTGKLGKLDATLSKAYLTRDNNLQSPVGTFSYFRGVDRDEGSTRQAELALHYQERIYGSTKMTKVFRNGLVMLRMCWHGFLKLKLGS